MDHSSEEQSFPEEHSSPAQRTNPLNVGFALVTVFAIGLALGFFGRPTIIDDVPIQVVVTVVPNNSGRAVNQAPGSADSSRDNASPSNFSGSIDETNTAATEPEAAAASAQATPTIMEFVMADARHIQGNGEASVTIIEFSDFK